MYRHETESEKGAWASETDYKPATERKKVRRKSKKADPRRLLTIDHKRSNATIRSQASTPRRIAGISVNPFDSWDEVSGMSCADDNQSELTRKE